MRGPLVQVCPDGIDASIFVALRERWRQDFPGWIAENTRPFFSADTSQAMLDWGSSMMQQIPLKVAIDTNRSMVDADVRPDLKRIRLYDGEMRRTVEPGRFDVMIGGSSTGKSQMGFEVVAP